MKYHQCVYSRLAALGQALRAARRRGEWLQVRSIKDEMSMLEADLFAGLRVREVTQ